MIRLYRNTDKNNVIKLLQLNTPQFFSQEEEGDCFEYLSLHSADYFVVEISEVLVACGGINYGFDNGKTVRLSWDIVHPDYQGKGIGRELLLYRIEQIKSNRSVERIVVRTSQYVYQFYEKAGFVLIHTEENFWAKGFDLYEMVLELK